MSSELIKEENGIVFIQKDNVFTNSKIIADGVGIRHDKLKRIIEKHTDRLKNFGGIFYPRKVEINRKEKRGRHLEVYDLNEQQSTFLITQLNSRSEKAIDFTEELVRQFFAMREELRKRQVARPIYLEARRTLTDSINALPESGHKGRKYKHYTDLLYKIVIGKNAAQIRKELGLGEGQSVVDFLSAEQYNEIAKLEEQAAMLIEMGFEYEQIKSGLYKMYEKMKNNKLLPVQTRLVGV